MKISITGRHLDVTPAIREFTEERLARLERAMEGILDAHVVLFTEKHRHIAEIVVKGKHLVLTGTQESEDMYISIGKALEKIENQARRQRDKLIDTRRRSTRKGGNGAGPNVVIEEEMIATLSTGRLLVRDEDYPHKPMSAEEAAEELLADERPFLVFRDAGSGRIGVVYPRADGHVGLILPED